MVQDYLQKAQAAHDALVVEFKALGVASRGKKLLEKQAELQPALSVASKLAEMAWNVSKVGLTDADLKALAPEPIVKVPAKKK